MHKNTRNTHGPCSHGAYGLVEGEIHINWNVTSRYKIALQYVQRRSEVPREPMREGCEREVRKGFPDGAEV